MRKTLAGMAAMFIAGAACAATSASYVQRGLIAQWDGIDNAGTGVHDPDATVWKDLKGNLDMTLTSKGRWMPRGNALFVSGMGAQGTNAAPAYKTIEVVYRMAQNGGRLLFVSGLGSRIVAFDPAAGIPKKLYFDGAASTKYIGWSLDTAAFCSAAATYSGNSVANVYSNGVASASGTLGNGWGVGDGKVAVGNRSGKSGDASYNWTGEVYAIRLYDEVLTAEEIAANHAIDLERFQSVAQEQGPTAADYVQDGLLVQWDGIDNAGTGVHDPTATTWKNLKGGGYDLTLTNNAVWNAEGRALVVNGVSAAGATAAPAYKTIEVVFKRTNTGGRILFNSGIKSRFVLFDGTTSFAAYFTGVNPTKRIYQPSVASEINFFAARYDDDDMVTDVFKDADLREDGTISNPWNPASTIFIGGRIMPGKDPEYLWYGEVYAIRLYSTRLTKAQLAHNHRIDCQRFLTSSSYIQEGLTAHWDGIDNAGRGLHDSTTTTWKNLASGGQDLTIVSGLWSDMTLMSLGKDVPAATGTVQQTYTTLEAVFRNLNHGASTMMYSGGLQNRFLALGPAYTQWTSVAGSTNFNRTLPGVHSVAGVLTGSKAFVDGSPAYYNTAYTNWWDPGTNYVHIGARICEYGAYAFSGDFYVLRTYSSALSATQVAYNFKVDRQRFGLGPRSFRWNNRQDNVLASGAFGTNGNWKVVENTSSVPGASDAAVLPAGDYTVTLDDERVLETLAIEDGATLKIALPADVEVTPLTVVKGVEAAAGAGLELEAKAFNKAHHRESVTLIECGTDSSAALQRLADSLNAKLRRVRATVEDGTKLIYTAPPPGGVTLVVR